jgi:hypothetical protein
MTAISKTRNEIELSGDPPALPRMWRKFCLETATVRVEPAHPLEWHLRGVLKGSECCHFKS